MRKNLFTGGIAGLLLFSITVQAAYAQSDPKLEVGAQFALMRHSLPGGSSSGSPRWDPGFGGRITYDVARNLSLEAELNFFPREIRNGPKTQALFGIKAGRRTDKFGLFAKVRPGFVRFADVFDCPGTDRRSCGNFAHTEYALDIGGVVEFYAAPRTVLRFDVGDTIIRYRNTKDFPFSPELPTFPRFFDGRTRNNLQLNMGIGFRF